MKYQLLQRFLAVALMVIGLLLISVGNARVAAGRPKEPMDEVLLLLRAIACLIGAIAITTVQAL